MTPQPQTELQKAFARRDAAYQLWEQAERNKGVFKKTGGASLVQLLVIGDILSAEKAEVERLKRVWATGRAN